MFIASSIKSKSHNDWISPKGSDDDGEFMLTAPHPLLFKDDECEDKDNQVIEDHKSFKFFHPCCESQRENQLKIKWKDENDLKDVCVFIKDDLSSKVSVRHLHLQN